MKKNEWTFVTSMVEPHYGHAGTVHADLMYISGMETLMDKGKLSFYEEGDSLHTVLNLWLCGSLSVRSSRSRGVKICHFGKKKKKKCQTLNLDMMSLPS